MSRRLIIALLAISTPALADAPVAPPDMSDQAVEASVGVATGGRVTPGGLRIEGHYLYQLSDRDWFDGVAGFTFGGGAPECFRDRQDNFICDHGIAQGGGFEISGGVRHYLAGNDQFWPFVEGGIGVRYIRFGNDDVSGIGIPLHAGGGIRVSLTPALAISAQGQFEFGIGDFSHSLGAEPQLGISITAGVEFRL
jgi:hypothetical protein